MGFWNTSSSIGSYLWCTKPFQPLLVNKDAILSTPWGVAQQLHSHDLQQKMRLQVFLQTYFGTPPTSPIFDIPEESLLGPHDVLFYVSDNEYNVLGCVRYHHIGQLESNTVYLVDCFCIHPQFRKKGLADYLLTTLHRYANEHGIPYALFLKEGLPLPIWSIPLYTGSYMYKQVKHGEPSNALQALTPTEAHRLLRIFSSVIPDRLIIQPSSTANQSWRLYRGTNHQLILACIQDCYQWLVEDNGTRKKMGWMTAWLESSTVTDNCRRQAMNVIADSMVNQFDYVWANKEWIGSGSVPHQDWKEDGTFHWYAYQWTTSLNIKNGYCIIH